VLAWRGSPDLRHAAAMTQDGNGAMAQLRAGAVACLSGERGEADSGMNGVRVVALRSRGFAA